MKTQRYIAMAICAALLVSGCGMGSMETFFATPGTYDYFNCGELAKASVTAQERERELKTLIDRAEQGFLGGLIATTAYRSQYLKAQGEVKLVAETAQSKNCKIDPVTGKIDGTGPRR